MSITQFITQDEIEHLPDNDPQAAFAAFVHIAERRLKELELKHNGSSASEREELNLIRHGFMNVVIAAAKEYKIAPFLSHTVPTPSNFDPKRHYEFKAELDHYLTQLLLDQNRGKRNTVLIPPELKTTIRNYINGLRQLIEKADDIDPAKREKLLNRLSEFEAELEKKRLNLVVVATLLITFASAPGGIYASFEPVNKLLSMITTAVGDAKIAEDSTRQLPPSVPPKMLTRSPADDDEIPF